MKSKALVLQARGTNRDLDVIEALELAGTEPVGFPLNELRREKTDWNDFQILVLPGGFSYADALGAGKLLALDLTSYFFQEINAFVASGKPVIGICNGFQALVKSGILPGRQLPGQNVTLTFNARGNFECRWVTMQSVSQTCVWTYGLSELVTCPVAHGEGNFQTSGSEVLEHLAESEQIALVYVNADRSPANGEYPANPNGSSLDIAGICNSAGNVLGLMPHPENHIHGWQHPRHTRGESGQRGLHLFENGIRYADGL
jgi:phosphoribosylformylglycinamidine synthase